MVEGKPPLICVLKSTLCKIPSLCKITDRCIGKLTMLWPTKVASFFTGQKSCTLNSLISICSQISPHLSISLFHNWDYSAIRLVEPADWRQQNKLPHGDCVLRFAGAGMEILPWRDLSDPEWGNKTEFLVPRVHKWQTGKWKPHH